MVAVSVRVTRLGAVRVPDPAPGRSDRDLHTLPSVNVKQKNITVCIDCGTANV